MLIEAPKQVDHTSSGFPEGREVFKNLFQSQTSRSGDPIERRVFKTVGVLVGNLPPEVTYRAFAGALRMSVAAGEGAKPDPQPQGEDLAERKIADTLSEIAPADPGSDAEKAVREVVARQTADFAQNPDKFLGQK